jgi:hypothetical protein
VKVEHAIAPRDKNATPGMVDLVLFMSAPGEVIHSAVYLSDGLHSVQRPFSAPGPL